MLKGIIGDEVLIQTRIDDLRAKLSEAERERDEANQKLFCPSVWICDKCNFTLTKSILYVQGGNIGQDKADHLEPCPNDGRDMRRITWEEMARDANKICDQQVKRAYEAEQENLALKKRVEVLEAIAAYAIHQTVEHGKGGGSWCKGLEEWSNHGLRSHPEACTCGLSKLRAALEGKEQE